MKEVSLLVLDVGGTKINIGHFVNNKIKKNTRYYFSEKEEDVTVTDFLILCIQQQLLNSVDAISIGVPSIVDVESGMVFDAVNIESWKELNLKEILELRFSLPVYINNDANCFAMGEAIGLSITSDMMGVCLGTGIGAGIVIDGKSLMGENCSAGEIGCIPYLNGTFDDYCSGKFFIDHYQKSAEELAAKAFLGDDKAKESFVQFGEHLGNAIIISLLLMDPPVIVIGGSISKAFELFIHSVWKKLESFPYQRSIKKLKIVCSEQKDSALIGAAHLYLQYKSNHMSSCHSNIKMCEA